MRYTQTMAFTTLVFFSLCAVFNSRSDEQSAFVGMFANKWLWAAVVLSLVLQAAVVHAPFLQNAFTSTSLSGNDWLVCALIGSSVLWLREIEKPVRRRRQ